MARSLFSDSTGRWPQSSLRSSGWGGFPPSGRRRSSRNFSGHPPQDYGPGVCDWLQGYWRGVLRTALLVALLVGLVTALGGLAALERGLLDRWMRWRPLERLDERVVIVEVTEGDLRRIGELPLSDQLLAQGLERLIQGQPRVIGLDLYRDMPQEPGHDRLQEILETTPNLIGIEKALEEPVAAPPDVADGRTGGSSGCVGRPGWGGPPRLGFGDAGGGATDDPQHSFGLNVSAGGGGDLRPVPQLSQLLHLRSGSVAAPATPDGGLF